MQSEVKELSFKGVDIYIGLDVHFKNWIVSIMVGGMLQKTFSQNPCAEELSKYVNQKYPGGNYHSVYEAGFCGYSVHRALEKNGIKNIIVNPADIPTTDKDKRQKEDMRDSRKLARSLSNNDLEGIYIMSISGEELRSLVRYRKTIVKEIVRSKNRVKAVLKQQGIQIPKSLDSASKYWSSLFTKWLKEIKMETAQGDLVLQDLIEMAEYQRKKLLKLNREFRRLAKDSPYSKLISLLRSIPGIGLIVSFTLLSELETIKRFSTLDKLCSYVGLIPTTHSSGENDRVGKITRRSNKPLRSVIVESAWVAIRNDPSLILKYNELKKRMPANKAIIRIAKKLLNRIRYVLKNEQEYVKSIV
jgi:transposase